MRSPQAFAATIVTRLCLDRLKSARARREEYVGSWLPEPVLTKGEEAPDVLAERSESVTLAFLVLLETLSAEERAVFPLKEVFDYGHAEIAGMLGTTAANSRQLFHRAKAKVRMAPGGNMRVPAPGKGHVRSLKLLFGLNRSARATGLASKATLHVVEVNSEPAIVLRISGRLDGVFVLSIHDGAIAAIRVVRNPEKLAYLDRQLAAIM